jgi:hypothetical protein
LPPNLIRQQHVSTKGTLFTAPAHLVFQRLRTKKYFRHYPRRTVRNAASKEILPFAIITLDGEMRYSTVSDENGEFKMSNILPGNYTLTCSCLGYEKLKKQLTITSGFSLSLGMTSNNIQREVVVTADESRGIASASRIDRLNFSSQTFFGKYFKRLTGMSPKSYREMKLNNNSQ